MRVQVNLATRPFVELRPFFLRLRLVMAALAVAGLAIAIGAHILSARAAKQQLELDRLRNLTIAAQNSKLHTEQRMRDPANARVLDRAHFLNARFLAKSFSWTAVMMDLENVLPNGVQVTTIEPQVSPDGNVIIRLRVAGERANAVQLVRNLERSRRFLHPRLTGEASQLKEGNTASGIAPRPNPAVPAGPPGVEFDILADYNPLPPGESYPVHHERAAAPAATGQPQVIPIPPALRVPGNRPSANLRRGYPADGVHLPPYTGPAPSSTFPTPPQRTPR
jgi:type IV pilus assembly protein PilN